MDKKILHVERVGFYGNTKDNRSPEDFPFPSCMVSVMKYLGEDSPVLTLYDNNQSYTKRTPYDGFLAATGMGFGLLFSDNYCPSAYDLTQVNDHDETINRAFRWAGYACEIIEQSAASEDAIKEKIVSSIDAGIPVLAFGIIGPPECLIVTGYDNNGDTLIGWSFFTGENTETEPNGMFRASSWYDELWKIVLPGQKTGRLSTLKEIVQNGIAIMEKTEADGYRAGAKAYDKWIEMIETIGGESDEVIQSRYELHHGLVGNHAEARAFCGSFLRDNGLLEPHRCFQAIHDTCWKIWGAEGDTGWASMKEETKRETIIALLREMRALDEQALTALKIDLTLIEE